MLCAQAWKPGSQHAGEKRGVAGLLLGRTERAARAAELQLCVVMNATMNEALLPTRPSVRLTPLKSLRHSINLIKY